MAGKESRWTRKQPRWLLSARIVAALVLLDQAAAVTSIPASEAIVIACIGALCAPVPVERSND